MVHFGILLAFLRVSLVLLFQKFVLKTINMKAFGRNGLVNTVTFVR